MKKRIKNKDKNIQPEAIAPKFSDVKDLSTINEDALSDDEKELLKEEKNRRSTEKSKLDEAEQIVAKKSQKKKKITNIIFFIINIIVVAGILTWQLMKEPFVSLTGLGLNVGMLFVLVFLYAMVLLMDILSMGYLIKKETKRWQWGLSSKTIILGRYYDSLSPMSVAGEPFQVIYLNRHDIPATASLSVPVAKLMFQQLSFFVISIIALVVAWSDPSYGTFASIMSILGFTLTFSILFIIIFLSISKNVGKKMVVKCLKLLQKIKIIKNYEKQYQRVTKYVEDYQAMMTKYMKSIKDLIINFSLALLKFVFMFAIPFVIYRCFFPDGTIDLFFRFFICGVLIELASGVFPLPGGTGMNEITFGALFSAFFSGGRLFWALIFWRLATYYAHLIIGFFVFSYDITYGNKKFKWNKKQRELQSESLGFKQLQIQKFRKERNNRRRRAIQRGE